MINLLTVNFLDGSFVSNDDFANADRFLNDYKEQRVNVCCANSQPILLHHGNSVCIVAVAAMVAWVSMNSGWVCGISRVKKWMSQRRGVGNFGGFKNWMRQWLWQRRHSQK
jgi:hypothetical protein